MLNSLLRIYARIDLRRRRSRRSRRSSSSRALLVCAAGWLVTADGTARPVGLGVFARGWRAGPAIEAGLACRFWLGLIEAGALAWFVGHLAHNRRDVCE